MNKVELNDPYFRVEIIRAMPNPQQVIWAAMHQDYSEHFVYDEYNDGKFPATEKEAGELIVKHLLAGGRGHYGPLEHAQIVLNVGFFPHSLLQQIRTHRVGVSFDGQSFRYTSNQFLSAYDAIQMLDAGFPRDQETIEELFYIRPCGAYSNRQGKKYRVTQSDRIEDIEWCWEAICKYRDRMNQGYSEEHARSMIPFDVRQHWVFSCNVRSLMHLLDLRWKKDAQLEAQKWAEMTFTHFANWCPEIAEWYLKNRAQKARLSP